MDPSAGSCSGSWSLRPRPSSATSSSRRRSVKVPSASGGRARNRADGRASPWVERSASACWRSTRTSSSSTPPRAVTTPSSCCRPTPPDTLARGGRPSSIRSASAEPVVRRSTAPVLPRHVAIVGDSQAHSLAINLPDGIGDTFVITDGSVDGCGVHDSGRVLERARRVLELVLDLRGLAAGMGGGRRAGRRGTRRARRVGRVRRRDR